ncbi:unnamed protein product [marine sediment metagenome]|uniref:Uncharacterized protein n=1 Tax=marine sediment metagenome TaxID=412755 RepID=X0XYY5_9ZZZZ
MNSDSNIGEVGVGSIRLNGKRVQDLPLGQGNDAKSGLKDAIDQERINKIETINAKYPTLRVDYIDSRIDECKENMLRVQGTMTEQATMISEYKGHINMSGYRDKEIVKFEGKVKDGTMTDEALKQEKRDLFKRFPPYQIPAMEQQIVQCHEAINRCEKVIEAEQASVAELTEVKALCKQRDVELSAFGAVAEG